MTMKMKLVGIRQLVLAMILAIFALSTAIAETPEEVIRDTADQMISALKKEKATLQKNPDRLYDLVEQILVPRFDFETISQWVMGRTWRSATDAQRVEFTQEFKRLLINSYAGVLLEYTDERIDITPLAKGADQSGEVTLRTEIISSQRAPVSINYSMIKSGNRWLVYDVSVEGVSIVTNYRSEIRELVSSRGIDGMIQVLKQKNRE